MNTITRDFRNPESLSADARRRNALAGLFSARGRVLRLADEKTAVDVRRGELVTLQEAGAANAAEVAELRTLEVESRALANALKDAMAALEELEAAHS